MKGLSCLRAIVRCLLSFWACWGKVSGGFIVGLCVFDVYSGGLWRLCWVFGSFENQHGFIWLLRFSSACYAFSTSLPCRSSPSLWSSKGLIFNRSCRRGWAAPAHSSTASSPFYAGVRRFAIKNKEKNTTRLSGSMTKDVAVGQNLRDLCI